MTEDYYHIVNKVNKSKFYPQNEIISSFDTEIQKSVAVCMWDYVREHLDMLHSYLTKEQLDYDYIDYGYEALHDIKKDFCNIFYMDTGVSINWMDHCILCNKYKQYDVSSLCGHCPLGSCASRSDNPYHTLVRYALHNESRKNALSAIDSIIKAIKEALI